jgi:transmembrane sensor
VSLYRPTPIMNIQQAEELLDRYLDGNCTPREKALVEEFYRQHADSQNLPSEVRNDLWAGTMDRIHQETKAKKPALYKYAAAAAVLLVAVSGILLFKHNGKPLPANNTLTAVKPIVPGKLGALLTLSSGKQVNLDSGATGVLATEGNQKITKLQSGQIAYQPAEAATALAPASILYNTLSTLRGKYYELALSDGSKVWLNSASSITYPAAFTGPSRKVKITGEVYFEVTKDAEHPFIVEAGAQTVQVLGTHFNIMAYADEPGVTTTLLEGSVKVTNQNSFKIIKPGQAANTLNGDGRVNVTEVDVADAIAWKEGYFKFNSEELSTIMRKVSRWYDVDVEFKDHMENKKIYGTYARSKAIKSLLNDLELTGSVHFKTEGRRIIVMK